MKTLRKNPIVRWLFIVGVIVVVIVVYAFGFSVTDVNFETTRDEVRLTQLTRILRALAHPDILEYEQIEQDVDLPFHLPCPPGGAPPISVDTRGAYIVVTPACAGPKETVSIEGFKFLPNTAGPVNFLTQSGAKLQLGSFKTDSRGSFSIKGKLPNRQPIEEAQTIRATARQNVGAPRISRTGNLVFEKIVETVFLALLATTFGAILAIPLSFLAAQNLMSDIRSPLTSVSLTLLGWPIGIWLGGAIAIQIGRLAESISGETAFVTGGVALGTLAIGLASVSTLPRQMERFSKVSARLVRGLGYGLAGLAAIATANLVAHMMLLVGDALIEPLGALGFFGNFVYQLGDSLRMLTPAFAALIVGGVLGSLGGRVGQQASDQLDSRTVRIINLSVAALAGAALFALIGAAIDWFYQVLDPTITFVIPATLGAIGGALLTLRVEPRQPLPLGYWVYFALRTLFNGIRSVEPLVMVIVFVVWVGIGPFAGVVALALHTVAALGKLFSEQVENIALGPLEAVRATGANRAQVIKFAVVPQIVPPYISFLMYRWDINVRFSTIIGFAGGGGIGFLLQQNIRLLDYRSASAAMLAIAIVVSSMDYISSAIRRRFV
ncbi:MAG: ABC transporter permease subunit [Anaerolineales bacterium]|nr:ABC transporter permease subunit [Anaerolineales bacterium]